MKQVMHLVLLLISLVATSTATVVLDYVNSDLPCFLDAEVRDPKCPPGFKNGAANLTCRRPRKSYRIKCRGSCKKGYQKRACKCVRPVKIIGQRHMYCDEGFIEVGLKCMKCPTNFELYPAYRECKNLVKNNIPNSCIKYYPSVSAGGAPVTGIVGFGEWVVNSGVINNFDD